LHVGLIFQQAPYSLAQQNMVMHEDAANSSVVPYLCVGTHRLSLTWPEKIGKRRRIT
jgi:hypothetical protein